MTMDFLPISDDQQQDGTETNHASQNDVDIEIEDDDETAIPLKTSLKLAVATLLLLSSVTTFLHSSSTLSEESNSSHLASRRRLSSLSDSASEFPTYMASLMRDLEARKKLFDETPPEEVKYWFEYTGPLQKYFYRFSKERQKADSFEGRDDSGVASARFNEPGGGSSFQSFYNAPEESIPTSELPAHFRILDNCFALGNEKRPDLGKGGIWEMFFGSGAGSPSMSFGHVDDGKKKQEVMDRCRILITLNTVGAGRGSTILWETNPPPIHASGPTPWMSEQETAGMHLERNLKELNGMCQTGLIAIRLQVLVCEPIPGVWTDWMDSMLPNCGGRAAPLTRTGSNANSDSPYEEGVNVEDRPSPVQVVVVANAATADTCHDLKSGFMEKRMQDLILAPPFLSVTDAEKETKSFNPAVKTTHPDLVSSDDHDLYIGMKWTSLITIRAVTAFAQASADIAAAAASPNNQEVPQPETNADGVTVTLNKGPSSPFLIPSFVRMSYVSEENNKIAKWRMHGDFFHPAAWEICKDSFDMTWIPDSLSGNGGVNGICYENGSESTSIKQRLDGDECGQWWIYMAEEQMPTSPEVYANEATSPIVQGGSNFFWMLTERHRREVVTQKVCVHNADGDKDEIAKCGEESQSVIPLGDMESFIINFTPNTALGKKHSLGRKPGYSKEKERKHDRDLVKERKQLKGQEDIEKALFDYTVYPAALFRKDATLKAARSRDYILTKQEGVSKDSVGPQTVKSSYYDVTITKPRAPTSGWCQAIARNGLCVLYADYFRQSSDIRCMEACGLKKNWTPISAIQT